MIRPAIFFFVACLLASFTSASASIPIEQAAKEKKEHYLKQGVFVGGFEQGPMVLTNVRHSYQPDTKLERLVLDVSPEGKPQQVQRPGFFHISIQKNGSNRLIIDLADCTETKVTSQQVTKILTRSHYFASAKFFLDEEGKSLTIDIPVKTSAAFEVFELASDEKPGRIVIDAKGL